MARIDELLNTTLPLLDVVWTDEGEAAGIPDPDNIGEGFELVGRLTQAESTIHMTHVWITEVDQETPWVREHVHDYDEVLTWTGSDPGNPRDLGAEIYLEIEGERRIITTSGSAFIPAGVKHCPLGFIRVDRPFTFSALSLAPEYASRRG
ncbi:hypothetical protein ACFOE1_11800 [Agromyces mediolanus]|uniref:Cupin domain-containing protein n=1 Tax=Agromyces mediolanus TaxID=41986 RepID=A0A918C9Q5_AGRME|nr:hypothetical protein [Agromyces mediolanus]GGR13972.1 hypothetical protein GCM10010196_03160 [Agromyces mediolanus]GLJ72720.1 hypothetical protein GCM10017583_19760 [Agromyces mediolanus]